MKILICGLGALGTVYGCLLKKQGHYVAGLDRPEVVGIVRSRGLSVNGIWGEHETMLDDVCDTVTSLAESQYDIIIVSVKAFHTASALKDLGAVLVRAGYVMLAQNGLGNYETALQFVPDSRLIAARVIFGSVSEAPGIARVTVIADDVLIGSPSHVIDEAALEEWAGLFRDSGIPTRTSDQIMGYIWAKVIYNSALNPMGAILELPYGKLAEIEFSRNVMDNIIREIFIVMQAAGQTVPWPDASAYLEEFYRQMVPTTAGHHASMLQDIRNGRKTEIDALNGAIVVRARELGVEVPYNEVVCQLLKAKEMNRLESVD